MEFELRRQLFHIFLGIGIITLYYFDLINAFMLFLGVVAIALGSFIQTKIKIPIITWWVNNFERPKLRKKFPALGMLTFFIGCFLVVRLFPKDIALASIMILTLGDSINVLVGKNFGKLQHPLNKKRLYEGTLGGMLFAFLGAMLFVNPFEAFIASFFAMSVEAIDFRYLKINDNIIMPLVAAIVIFILRIIL